MPRKHLKEFTTIAIKKTTRERLKEYGFKGDTYDSIVNKLMDTYDKQYTTSIPPLSVQTSTRLNSD
jgi:hypothetical protein